MSRALNYQTNWIRTRRSSRRCKWITSCKKLLSWEPSDADDLAGYIIYLCNGGFQMAIDTVYDPAATWYIDMNSNVQSYIESYNVAAFDECFINSEPDPGALSPYCASSLFLNATTTLCSDQTTLSWAGAYNLDSEVASYHILTDEEMPTGSGNWSGLQEVGVVDANTNAFVHEGATFGATYKYHIVAEMASGLEILSNVGLSSSATLEPRVSRRYAVLPFRTVERSTSLSTSTLTRTTHAYTLQRKRSSEAEFTTSRPKKAWAA